MLGASRFRKAARMIGLPCGSFSRRQSKEDHIVVNNVSSSPIAAKRENFPEIADAESSSAAKNLCAICLEPLSLSTTASPAQAIFTAQCSHAFHFNCISSNVRHGSVTCPICRAHWTQLPRNLKPPSSFPCSQADPILRVLDDSIATSHVHRRYSRRSTRYNDDDPIEPDHTPNHPRLHLTLIPIPLTPPSFPPCGHPCLQVTGATMYHPYGLSPSSSLTSPQDTTLNGQKPYLCSNRAYLSVKLAHQQATDLVLVASPNGPHLRLLKQSMALVVLSLRSVDRLAFVTYSSATVRPYPLRRMTSHGKRTALQIIDRLFYMGEADPAEGLRKGMKILVDRAHENPQSCILHLFDSPTRTHLGHDIEVPIPIHGFQVGLGFSTSNGLVMHEFEEFLARLLGGVIRETQLKIGVDGRVVRLGELRGGEERRIPLHLGDTGFVRVHYSYIEGRVEERIRIGEIVVSLEDDTESNGGRTSSVESWDHHDPCMTGRWEKHLHGNRL